MELNLFLSDGRFRRNFRGGGASLVLFGIGGFFGFGLLDDVFTLDDGLRNQACDQANGTDGVVVAGNRVINLVRVGVGVANGHNRNAHAAGFGLLYQLTGEKKYADLGRECTQKALDGQRDRDDRYSFRVPGGALRAGPSIGMVAMGYDLCYDGWDDAFRQTVAKALVEYNEGSNMDFEGICLGKRHGPHSNHWGCQIGGGGLASGVALALKSQGVRIVGAQVEGVDAMARALKGDDVLREPAATLADGVKVKEPGTLTRALLRDLLDDVVIVREAELRETLVRLALEEHVIAEGAGALALAAGRRVAGKRKCAVVSGGNLDAGVLARLLSDVRPRAPRKPRRRADDATKPVEARTDTRNRIARLPARKPAIASTEASPAIPDTLVTPLEAIA